MAEASVASGIYEAPDMTLDFTTEIPFHLVVPVNDLPDTDQLLRRHVLHPWVSFNTSHLDELDSSSGSYPVHPAQGHL